MGFFFYLLLTLLIDVWRIVIKPSGSSVQSTVMVLEAHSNISNENQSKEMKLKTWNGDAEWLIIEKQFPYQIEGKEAQSTPNAWSAFHV